MNEEERKQKLEDEILGNIDYNGQSNITFNQEFAFHMQALPPSLSRAPDTAWVDTDMHQDLLQARILNWCRTADPLYPIRTKSDGNCLCHAVSMAIWGTGDDRLTLRNLIYVSIASDGNKKRWRMHYQGQQTYRGSLQLPSNDWDREWKQVIETASSATTSRSAATPYHHLEAIHIFTLANILRRPIIVLADSTARTLSGTSLQESDIGGIYLPLDWSPQDCHKHPIVLGYTMSHFCPLLPQENMEKSTFTVPIVARDGASLPFRFLSADEERRAAGLLKAYLKVKEVPLSTSDTLSLVLSTEIRYSPLPNTSNVFAAPAHVTMATSNRQTITAEGVAATPFDPVKCITPGCVFFGSPATGNMCSTCLNKYMLQETQRFPTPQSWEPVDMTSTPGRSAGRPFTQGPSVGMSSTQEPTAPPPSMPLSGQFIDLSMMGENCHSGCGLRCSTKTYPYCHECAERQRSTVSQPAVAQNQAVITQNQPALVTESALFGTGNADPERVEAIGSKRCKGEGCDHLGRSHLGDLCGNCFIGEKSKKQICTSPGCTGFRLSNGYCSSCMSPQSMSGVSHSGLSENQSSLFAMGNQSPTQPKTGLPEKQEESTSGAHEGSSSLIESGSRCNAEVLNPVILTGPEDKIKCASPMCNTLIYPPNKLCSTCIDILMQSQASGSHQQQQNRMLLEPTVVSIKEEELPFSSLIRAGRSNSTPIAVRQHMMKVNLAEPSRPSSAPIGRKCLTPGCTRFGDPSMSNLCTNCYQQAGRTVPSGAGSEGRASQDPFQAMMSRVESQKRCPRQCKAANCPNYGNPNNEGFCNSCYPKYISMKMNL